MTPREALLDRRRQLLQAQIAAQRDELGERLEAFRGPLRAFEVARSVGEKLRRNAPVIGLGAAFAGLVLVRGGMFARAVRTVRVMQRATSVLGLIRLALRAMQRRPIGPA